MFMIKTLWLSLINDTGHMARLSELTRQRNQVIFLLIYNAGLKVSDLSKLKVDQLILGGSPRVIISPTNRDPYSIPLNRFTAKIINRYLNSLELEKVNSKINFSELLYNANPHKILSGGRSRR